MYRKSYNTVSFSVLYWLVLQLLMQKADYLNSGYSGLKVTINAARSHKRESPTPMRCNSKVFCLCHRKFMFQRLGSCLPLLPLEFAWNISGGLERKYL